VLPGQGGEADGLGDGQPDRRDAGRAGLAAAVRDGRVAEGDLQLSVADAAVAAAGAVAGGAGGGQGDAAVQRAADGGGAELGEGGQCSVPADGLEEPGLGLVPGQDVLSRLERFFSRPLLIPVKKKSSLASRVHPGRY
jgi:hypothetical protein